MQHRRRSRCQLAHNLLAGRKRILQGRLLKARGTRRGRSVVRHYVGPVGVDSEFVSTNFTAASSHTP